MMTQEELWNLIVREAQQEAEQEPILASFLYTTIINHKNIESATSYHLANKLATASLLPISLMELFMEGYRVEPHLVEYMCKDLVGVFDRDPACDEYSIPLLYFKGYHALQSYRIGNWLWRKDRKSMALKLQSRISEVFGVDIHPAATIGHGVFFDHATGVVVGETARIGNNVSILHSVTLGGTGKVCGDRHPKVADGVLIGAGTKLLGNIKIGEGAKIGAGSVVLEDIPSHSTAVGVPAQIIGSPEYQLPALEMNHKIQINDDYII